MSNSSWKNDAAAAKKVPSHYAFIILAPFPPCRYSRINPSARSGHAWCIEEREERPKGREIRGKFTETIEAFVGDRFWPAHRSSGRSVGGEDNMHRAVESGDGEFWSNCFALCRLPVVNAPESSEMIAECEEEDTPLAEATFSIVEYGNLRKLRIDN